MENTFELQVFAENENIIIRTLPFLPNFKVGEVLDINMNYLHSTPSGPEKELVNSYKTCKILEIEHRLLFDETENPNKVKYTIIIKADKLKSSDD